MSLLLLFGASRRPRTLPGRMGARVVDTTPRAAVADATPISTVADATPTATISRGSRSWT